MFDHEDTFAELNHRGPLTDKLAFLHDTVQQTFPFIHRIAVILYNPKTDLLSTFVASSGDNNPLRNYRARLQDVPSLQEILAAGRPRLIRDLDLYAAAHDSQAIHTQRLSSSGFHSSYTMPIEVDDTFIGFIFFNSRQADAFSDQTLAQLDMYGHMISLAVAHELTKIRAMLATLHTARHITTVRDMETGAHLERMAHYSRLIAEELAERCNFTDEYIHHIFLFSPLHDIGKVGIPDAILKKPTTLSADEFHIMQQHVTKGREIIDSIIKDVELEALPHIEVLRNIAEYHHEAVDGHGYPHGLNGEQIPIEARIIAVADVFDALTSDRSYKQRWPNDEAFVMLRNLAGYKLDPLCVEALLKHRSEIEEIQQRFRETDPG
ncbi:MAG: HD domain-containing protein [Gammaproteobacteria bacterium]|nr:HD domain-containing protein [Gammaproteobacteria bacterium]